MREREVGAAEGWKDKKNQGLEKEGEGRTKVDVWSLRSPYLSC